MTNVEITENTTTVQVTENVVTVTAAPGVSSDTLTADIATHNALATAHGLNANIDFDQQPAGDDQAGSGELIAIRPEDGTTVALTHYKYGASIETHGAHGAILEIDLDGAQGDVPTLAVKDNDAVPGNRAGTRLQMCDAQDTSWLELNYTDTDRPALQVTGTKANATLDILNAQTGGGINLQATSKITLQPTTPPATSTTSGTAGQITFDDEYIYYCIATNLWLRSPYDSYTRRMKDLFGTALIGYWPLDDAAASAAAREVMHAYNGTVSGTVTFGGTGIGDGKTAASMAGAGVINLPDTGLESRFSGTLGAVFFWGKFSAAQLINGAEGILFSIYGDVNGDNEIRVSKSSTNNKIQFIFKANTTQQSVEVAYSTADTWTRFGMVWSDAGDYAKCYINDTLAATLTSIGTWSASGWYSAHIGARLAGGGAPLIGNVAHVMLINGAVTDDQITASALANDW